MCNYLGAIYQVPSLLSAEVVWSIDSPVVLVVVDSLIAHFSIQVKCLRIHFNRIDKLFLRSAVVTSAHTGRTIRLGNVPVMFTLSFHQR